MKSIKNIIFLFIIFSSYFNTASAQNTSILKEEAFSAFNYLNVLRINPELIKRETGINDRKIKKTEPLVWNETLAKVAEEKASDMASRNYFSHTNKKGEGINIMIHRAGYSLNKDFIKQKNSNFFESIHAGSSIGAEIIKELIIDKGIHPPGHRYHLLGVDEFYKNAVDCGIGIAYNPNSKYKYYCCIIIAKHDF